ncbi:MAG: sigma-54 dependent transcriptional regulator [Myxococcaceae bacterium]|nr:sigma-54 dependent transcriptional regulator [Myxococcaceae bacterium]MCI0673423.1 sigma-54 dependent transcriptional regulator [Myxococcaceae bacterium]
MERIVVLVVDDEESVRSYLADLLSAEGFQVRTASSGAQALEMLVSNGFDVALLDVMLPDTSGLEVVRRYRASGGTTPVVVMSALTGADDAVRALRMGATDYLTKPIDAAALHDVLARAVGRQPLRREAMPDAHGRPGAEVALEEAGDADERGEARQIVSLSEGMRRARALVERIADTDVPVLLLGESGTGKEVIAREIHTHSRRHNRPFIKVNCAALPAELLENELFGHEKGAFTGATAEKPGKFELADQGTIFLDEIGEIAIRLQAKLLQVLQDEEYFRVGGKKTVRVDARVVVATNRNLEREIELGNFREDLYYRLNVVAIRLPPLRERREDVPALVEHFLSKYGRRYRGGLSELPLELMRAFGDYDWPGNVRELENMVRRIVVLKDPMLVLEELRHGRAGVMAPVSLPTAHAGDIGVPVHPRDPGVAASGDTAVGVGVAPPVPVVPMGMDAGGNRVVPQPRYPSPFDAPQPPPPPPPSPESEMSLKDIGKRAAMLAERDAILAMLQRTAWNKRKAAGKLRISYKALLYKIKECGIIDPRSSAEF